MDETTSCCDYEGVECDGAGNVVKLDLAFQDTLVTNGNELNGPLPTEVGALATLTSLNLKSNTLTGSLPSEIGSLTAMTASL